MSVETVAHTPRTIFEAVEQIVREALPLNRRGAIISLDSRLVTDLDISSLKLLDICTWIEAEHDLTSSSDTNRHPLADEIQRRMQQRLSQDLGGRMPLGVPTIDEILTVRFICQTAAEQLGVRWIDPT